MRFVKNQGYFYGKQHPLAGDLAGFIMANRQSVKFRIQKDKTFFYSNFEIALELITKYWDSLYDVSSVDLNLTNKLEKNIVLCKRYPHNEMQFQIHLKKDVHQILDKNEKESFVQFCMTNNKNIKITNKNVVDYISGKSAYCWHGYFYVKDEKFLSALYIIIEKAIDKVQKYIKI
tara:strand:+ start:5194 stop:5718 length:525 start_codon:yes stop_codon:yes gene_type:complete